MTRTKKTIRIDVTIASRYAEWCQAVGVFQERITEALFVHALSTMNAEHVGQILHAAHEWKASQEKPKGREMPVEGRTP